MLGKVLFKKAESTPGRLERMVVDVPMENWDASTPRTLDKCKGSKGNDLVSWKTKVSVVEYWGGGEGRVLGQEAGEGGSSQIL